MPIPTWTCPINPAHIFTGDNTAWVSYLNHFPASHTQKDFSVILTPDPATPYQAALSISSLFGLNTHIDYITGTITWLSASGTYGYHFYLMYLKGDGDRQVNPHRLRNFHGVIGSSGSFLIGKVPAGGGRPGNRIDINQTLSDILFSSYPATKGDDYISRVDMIIKGWV